MQYIPLSWWRHKLWPVVARKGVRSWLVYVGKAFTASLGVVVVAGGHHGAPGMDEMSSLMRGMLQGGWSTCWRCEREDVQHYKREREKENIA